MASEPSRAGAPSVLVFDEARISYRTRADELNVVPGFSLSIGRGEAVGLVGESGSGKSTLAFAAMGYLGHAGRLVSGRILFEGEDMAGLSAGELRALRGLRMAMVYQDPMSSLNPVMKAGAQLMEVPMRRLGLGRDEARERALAMLAEVEFADPASILERYPHQLSGGQQQRVVIAMALMSEPALLILDEPTTGLDVTVEAAVLDLIGALRHRHDSAILFISHNLGTVARVSDRIAVLYAGELVEEAPAGELFEAPRHPYTRALFNCLPGLAGRRRGARLAAIEGDPPSPGARPEGCAFAPRCAFAKPGPCTSEPIALRASGERRVRCVRLPELAPWTLPVPAATTARAEPPTDRILDVSKLTKAYRVGSPLFGLGEGSRRVQALDGVSLWAGRGETLAIVGESGSGKSTLAGIVAGLEPGAEGVVRLNGVPVQHLKVEHRPEALRRGVQIVFQNPDGTLNPSHRVGYALARALRRLAGVERRRLPAEVARLLDLVRLPRAYAARKPRQLSGGEKQRVAIARALAGAPDLLIADEPVSALDLSVQAAIVNLLSELQEARGMTLLFISHDLALVRYLADRVAVMYGGRVMEFGPADEVFSPPFHPYTLTLLSSVAARAEGQGEGASEGPEGATLAVGCPFHHRCPYKLGSICRDETPPSREAGAEHRIACHIPLGELAAIGASSEEHGEENRDAP